MVDWTLKNVKANCPILSHGWLEKARLPSGKSGLTLPNKILDTARASSIISQEVVANLSLRVVEMHIMIILAEAFSHSKVSRLGIDASFHQNGYYVLLSGILVIDF